MQEFFIQLLASHPVAAPVIFVVLRSLSVIIPPLPGFVFDLVGVVFFGSLFGFLYGEIGAMLGAMVAFGLARKFRHSLFKKIFTSEKVKKWEVKISERGTFWALVALRLPTNSVFDYLNYAVGFTRISFAVFFFSTLIGSLPSMALFYFFGGWSFQQGIYYFAAFLVVVLILWFVVYRIKLRRRKRLA